MPGRINVLDLLTARFFDGELLGAGMGDDYVYRRIRQLGQVPLGYDLFRKPIPAFVTAPAVD